MAIAAKQAFSDIPAKTGNSFNIMEDSSASTASNTPNSRSSTPASGAPLPLVSSKMMNVRGNSNSKRQRSENIKSAVIRPSDSSIKVENKSMPSKTGDQQDENESRKNAENHPPPATETSFLGRKSQPEVVRSWNESSVFKSKNMNVQQDSSEVARLKKELDDAKSKIALQDEELSKARAAKCFPTSNVINSMQDAFAAQRPVYHVQDDARSDISDAVSTTSFQSRGNFPFVPATAAMGPCGQGMPPPAIWSQHVQRPFANRAAPPSIQPLAIHQGMRPYSSQISPVSAESFSSLSSYGYGGFGNARSGSRAGRGLAICGSGGNWSTCGSDDWSTVGAGHMMGTNSVVTPLQSPIGMAPGPVGANQPRPIGTPMNTNSTSFGGANGASWTVRPGSPNQQTYIETTEPLNYRRMLDKSISCDWKYITDKIVNNNDQQASIFLQQKLKVSTAEQKFEIVQAIVSQAFPLMVNRFGNFLVQRCLEHGTPAQILAIANAIRGRTIELSMDAFGCHVVQKAFDAVPEDVKAVMVRELLRNIPKTVVHRYACHVWQKLFELRWSDSPPQIMKYVNEALKGMWHEVALGETGSLVVQNIFENCLEEDKRPCISEVLNSIDIIAHGQFGNWCIQHICEHGAPADRTRAVDHVLKFATEYSMDQFASKVVEKCLKIGGSEFLDRYLSRVCEGRPDRPRIPLIDIASDQYGNYLIQHILTHAGSQHREQVASHIRKHMVSLRGSKFGSRVGMLCSNPAYASRPGVGAATSQSQRFASSGNTYGAIAQPTSGGTSGNSGYTGPVADGSTQRYTGNFH